MDISIHHATISLRLIDYILFAIIALGQTGFVVWVVSTMVQRRRLLRGQVLHTFRLHWAVVYVFAAISLATLFLTCGVIGIAAHHLPACKGNICVLASVHLIVNVGFLSSVSVLLSPFVTRTLVITDQGIVSAPVTARWPQIKRVEFFRHFFGRRHGMKVYVYQRWIPTQFSWYDIDEQSKKAVEEILAQKVKGYPRPTAAP